MMNEMLHSLGCFSYSAFRIPRSSFVLSLIPPSTSLFSFPHPLFWFLLTVGVSFVIACIVVAALSRHQKNAAGPLRLEGRAAQVVKALEPEGAVLVGGELWRARTRTGESIAGGRVRIVGARGHWLEVEAIA